MTPLLSTLTVLAAEAGGAPAGGAGAPAGGPKDLFTSLGPLLPIILIFVVFMWMMSRSQRKRDKERQALLEAIKPKDDVVTIGGIHGRVVKVDPETVVLRIDDDKDVKITMARSGISRILTKDDKQ
jgi:preprotein translocase subunit YajC